MRRKALVAVLAAALMVVALPATAAVHEITAAECNGRGGVDAPGQNKSTQALLATGFITAVDTSVSGQVTVNFDFTVPNSKFMAGSGDLSIPNGAGPGVTLILSPVPIPNPDFPAHANCPLFGTFVP